MAYGMDYMTEVQKTRQSVYNIANGLMNENT